MDSELKYFWNENVNVPTSTVKERFSLLLLEPAEIYFEDFSVYYYPGNCKEDEAIKKRQKGRFKICSKSVLFDPLNTSYPLLKFLYKDFVKIEKWTGTSLLSRLDQRGDMLLIESNLCVQIKEGNVVAPYKYIKEKCQHFFSLNFVNVNNALPKIEQLMRANTLNPEASESMINAIVEARQAMVKFNRSWIEDFYENIVYETTASKITPLVCNPGRLLLTSKQLYFQPFNNVEAKPVLKLHLSNIKSIIKRRYLLRQVGLEITQMSLHPDTYFMFQNQDERDKMFLKLFVQEELQVSEDAQENMTLKWQSGAVSNFDYLMYLNSIADRSFNDLTQYPVLPWVIKDYTSPVLDLENPNTFRDLSRPIGAMDERRLKQLKERCNGMAEPKFLYGSHYSSPGFVLFYLARVAPEYMLCLQNGKFDNADRLFSSIESTWRNCCCGHSDYKELIPEFYDSEGSFLNNDKNLSLGIKQDGSRVRNVHLPPWAKDAKDFVSKCRQALECEYVSQKINNWIDLIFGYKQTGQEAWNADNVFYYLTYEGAVDLENVNNENERYCLEAQILEFGQTPRQLFTKPHPKRQPQTLPLDVGHLRLDFDVIDRSLNNVQEEKQVIVNGQNSEKSKLTDDSSLSWLNLLKLKTRTKLHKDVVLGMDITQDGTGLFTVSQDCQLKFYSIDEEMQKRSSNLSSMALSCCQLVDNDKQLFVGSWDNAVYTYSVEYSRVIAEKHVHDDAVSSLCLKYDKFVTSSWDATVKIWAYTKDNRKSTLRLLCEVDHDTEVCCFDVFECDQGCRLVTGTKDGILTLWDIELLVSLNQQQLHSDSITKVLFSTDGSRLLTSSLDGCVKVLDVMSSVEIYSRDLAEPVYDALWDDQVAVFAGKSGDVIIWNLIEDVCTGRLESSQAGEIRCLSVNVEKRILVAGDTSGYISVWKLDKG